MRDSVCIKDPSGFERIGKSKKAEVILNLKIDEMSRRMRKPKICIGEDKVADQLCSNCTADQRLCFLCSGSTILLLLKSEISSMLL